LGKWSLIVLVEDLSGDFFGSSFSLRVGLLGNQLAALIGVGEGVPWLLIEVVVALGGAGLGLVVHLSRADGSSSHLVREPLAQPRPSAAQ